MLRSVLGVFVCLLLIISVIRFSFNSEPLSFYDLLIELQDFNFDYQGFIDSIVGLSDMLVFDYDGGLVLPEDVSWYDYIWLALKYVVYSIRWFGMVVAAVVLAVVDFVVYICNTIKSVTDVVFTIFGIL